MLHPHPDAVSLENQRLSPSNAIGFGPVYEVGSGGHRLGGRTGSGRVVGGVTGRGGVTGLGRRGCGECGTRSVRRIGFPRWSWRRRERHGALRAWPRIFVANCGSTQKGIDGGSGQHQEGERPTTKPPMDMLRSRVFMPPPYRSQGPTLHRAGDGDSSSVFFGHAYFGDQIHRRRTFKAAQDANRVFSGGHKLVFRGDPLHSTVSSKHARASVLGIMGATPWRKVSSRMALPNSSRMSLINAKGLIRLRFRWRCGDFPKATIKSPVAFRSLRFGTTKPHGQVGPIGKSLGIRFDAVGFHVHLTGHRSQQR